MNVTLGIIKAATFIINSLLKAVETLLWSGSRHKERKHICVHRVGQIGDVICSLPAIYLLRKNYPTAKITILTSTGSQRTSAFSELSQLIPWIDNVIQYNCASIKDYWALRKKLKAESFDIWVALPQDLTTLWTEMRNMLFARSVCSHQATGFRIPNLKCFIKLQSTANKFDQEAVRLLKLVKKADDQSSEIIYGIGNYQSELNRTPYNTPDISKFFADKFISPDTKLLIIVPGSNRAINQWSIEKFVEIARKWIQTFGNVIVVGGEPDARFRGDFEPLNNKCIFTCGEMSLLETALTITKGRVAVGNDTGPMHLAASLGIPTVSIMSARDLPGKWEPIGNLSKVIRVNTECSPCLKEICEYDMKCTKLISVDEVWTNICYIMRAT